MSDESEYDVEPEEFDIYKRKYQLLLERCEILQQVKSLLKRNYYR